MWSQVRAASRQSKPTGNEDAYAVSTTSLVLVDGASGVGESKLTSWGTDAAWFSHRLADLLADRLDNTEVPALDALEQVLEFMRREYEDTTGQPLSPDPTQRPSGSVLAARITRGELEVLTLGDCTAAVALRDGQVILLHDDTVTKRDQHIVDLAVARARARGLGVLDARQFVRQEMVDARKEMNTPSGYWVADLSRAGVPHTHRYTVPAGDVVDVVLMTDGFASALDPLRMFSSGPELVASLRQVQPNEAIASVVQLFDSDPDREKYPRLKHVDDITVIHAAA